MEFVNFAGQCMGLRAGPMGRPAPLGSSVTHAVPTARGTVNLSTRRPMWDIPRPARKPVCPCSPCSPLGAETLVGHPASC
eukprot:366116-Chlamydomonas_euryale.AAC.9